MCDFFWRILNFYYILKKSQKLQKWLKTTDSKSLIKATGGPTIYTVNPHYLCILYFHILLSKNLLANTKSVLRALLQSFTDMNRAPKTKKQTTKKSSVVHITISGNTLPSYFIILINKYPLHGVFSVIFFSFLCFSLVILLFKKATKHSTEMQSSVPRY